jgi:hypothetical protein
VRKADLADIDGARFLSVQNIARLDHPRAAEVASAIHRMVLTERDYAVVTSDPRTRAYLQQGTQAGTVSGELMRFLGMYKAFPVTVMTTHLARGLGRQGAGGKAAYLGKFFIGLTVLGMGAWQAKQMARGKDPVTMDPTTDAGRKAWGAAMLQGGGAGILGDFLFADQSRFGHGLAETLAGPAVGLVSDVVRLGIGNAQKGLAGEETTFLLDALKFGARYTPGSSLWYTRLALERTVLDQLALMDPDTRQGFARLERKARQDFGQGYWWRPGQMAPDRAPEISKVADFVLK